MSIVNVDPVSGREVLLMEAFAYNGQYEVKATGFRGTAAAGVVTNLDFAVGAEDRYINGLHFFLENHNEADTLSFYVVDVDGVLGVPPGTVLKQFGAGWTVDGTKSDQGRDLFNFVARIPAGVYIRVGYTSVGGGAVTVKLNAYLYKKVA